MPPDADFPHLEVPLDLEPMEALTMVELPRGPDWRYEPKWDGFRCLAFRDGEAIALRAKSGKPLDRYFPEVVEGLRRLPAKRFVLDGELVIAMDGALSFEALQMRLHPAESRIRKLSSETPARLVMFDCLADGRGRSLLDKPLTERRAVLEGLAATFIDAEVVTLSDGVKTRATAERWLAQAGGDVDGVVAKRLDEPYRPGERAMLKIKRLRTADCVVGGFRYLADGREVGSLLLGLYDEDGLLHHVGFTSTISNAERPELTRRLEGLVQPPGFTGKAPGGPSRWSTERTGEWEPLRPELVVEVRFDHVTGQRFRHGTKRLRWRPDKAPRQCTFEQLE